MSILLIRAGLSSFNFERLIRKPNSDLKSKKTALQSLEAASDEVRRILPNRAEMSTSDFSKKPRKTKPNQRLAHFILPGRLRRPRQRMRTLPTH
ncbi:hypothetical protein QC825_14990, partial [Larsenimonas suaedae]